MSPRNKCLLNSRIINSYKLHFLLQALFLARDAGFPSALRNGPSYNICLRSDSLHKVMERLANPGISSTLTILSPFLHDEGPEKEKTNSILFVHQFSSLYRC